MHKIFREVAQQAARDAATKANAAQTAAQQTAAEDATIKANAAKSDANTRASQAETKATQAMSAAAAVPSRIRTRRVAIPSLLAGIITTIDVVWDTPMPTLNYTVPAPAILGTSLLSLLGVKNLTKTGCTVEVKNISLSNLLTGTATLHILAIHDPF